MMDEHEQSLPDYNEFEAILQELNSSLVASECHGMVCAGLTHSREGGPGGISPNLFGAETETLVQNPDIARMLARLMLLSAGWLEQGSYDFTLFLPDDSDPLPTRSTALADWCRGYVMGLVEAGLTDFDKLPEDAAEVVRDLVAISELELSEDDDGSDEDLMQIEEFIRVGVQLVYENLNSVAEKE